MPNFSSHLGLAIPTFAVAFRAAPVRAVPTCPIFSSLVLGPFLSLSTWMVLVWSGEQAIIFREFIKRERWRRAQGRHGWGDLGQRRKEGRRRRNGARGSPPIFCRVAVGVVPHLQLAT